MSGRVLSSLRPHICKECHGRIVATSYSAKRFKSTPTTPASSNAQNKLVIQKIPNRASPKDAVEARIDFHGGETALQDLFPRSQPLTPDTRVYSAAEFAGIKASRHEVTVYGRLKGRRAMGQLLLFLELSTAGSTNETVTAQIKLSYNDLVNKKEYGTKAISKFSKSIWRGDWIAVTGRRGQDNEGRPRLDATRFPVILAPSLQNIPEGLTDPEFRVRHRHAEHIVNPSSRDILFLRAHITNAIRGYLSNREFIEVNTPLMVAGAGGAIARPFETVATEFSDMKLSLRVAPELFLKRLILGGMQKIYELGPAFRNEGVDPTHNPEFTICEFYAVMATLEDLIIMTQDLFRYLAQKTENLRRMLSSIPTLNVDFESSFKRLEFIPSLQREIQTQIDPHWTFPDLTDRESAASALKAIMFQARITLPMPPTLPRLLDTLASHFLEPLCIEPTFITHHPECMSPLAKSYLREPLSPGDHIRHRVSARAELFIRGREYVNCYEEENSPTEQRRKFEEQVALRAAGDEEASGVVDENYVQALSWGMPPTGGWGCGVDRIVMLFGGKNRIADVLPFGNLRNVVGLGRAAVLKEAKAEAQAQAQVREVPVQRAQNNTVDTGYVTKSLPTSAATSPPMEAMSKRPNALRTLAPGQNVNTKAWPSAKPKPTPPSPSHPQSEKKTPQNSTQQHAAGSVQTTNSDPESPPVPVMPKLMSFKDLMGATESTTMHEAAEHPKPSPDFVSFKGIRASTQPPKETTPKSEAEENPSGEEEFKPQPALKKPTSTKPGQQPQWEPTKRKELEIDFGKGPAEDGEEETFEQLVANMVREKGAEIEVAARGGG